MIYLIDNYDSFTYNLADVVRRYADLTVIRNDECSLEALTNKSPKALIISPGPGKPIESGISYPAVRYFMDKIPILGVCLGHQILAEILGASIVKATRPMHGKTSAILHKKSNIFKGLKNSLSVMRYHSLIIKPENLPDSLEITAVTAENEIMAICHKSLPLTGVQFHPESILTEKGNIMIKNWIVGIR